MKKIMSAFLCMIMFLTLDKISFAVSDDEISKIIEDTAKYIYENVENPQVGSIGGEWTVLGLARSGIKIPEEYYQNYYNNVEAYVSKCDGILHTKKYTEYSRVILALTAIGKNPENVAGYNLLMPLGDYEKTIWQGINGPIWALIALDSGKYEIPQNKDAKVQATREMYIEKILESQLSDGGWSLNEQISDIDVTGMAIQALANYKNDEKVKKSIDKALTYVSKIQNESGGFSSFGTTNSESAVQILVALSELGISIEDTRFVKNGYTILDNLLMYYNQNGAFKHTINDKDTNQMATEQAFYGLVALKRMQNNENSLYKMDDAIKISILNNIVGLKNKNEDVKKMEVKNHNKTFLDIKGNKNQKAIEELTKRNIVNGKTENEFMPDDTMTRAEFATIIVKGLGLPIKRDSIFVDVTKNDWFYDYVNTAYFYGIIKGVTNDTFNPNGTIKREEAAVMIARAAKLCGMDTEIQKFEARNILAEFLDYPTISDWAFLEMAFCYEEGILSKDVLNINPKEKITRGEIAQMVYKMLDLSKLL